MIRESRIEHTRDAVVAALEAVAVANNLAIARPQIEQLVSDVLTEGTREDVVGLLEMIQTLERGESDEQ